MKPLRIMSMNTLGNCGKLTISNRDDMLAEIINEFKPDALGLQEVSKKLRSEPLNLFEMIKEQYTEIPATVNNRSGVNGTPVVYNTETLKMIDSGYHFYIDGFCDNSKSASWAVFKRIGSDERFAFISTHFIHLDEGGRVIDAEQLGLLSDALIRRYDVPVFIGGDFNSPITDKSYIKLMELGFVDLHEVAKKADNCKSFHSYPVWDEQAEKFLPGTPNADDYLGSIDHIFYYGAESCCPDVLNYRLVTDERARTGSDHYPVFIDCILKKNATVTSL